MAIDWTRSMMQTYTFYEVDPSTWKNVKRIDNIVGCGINWDASADTLGNASITSIGEIEECYIRVYMVAIQDGISYEIPLGTYLVQSPASSFDGKMQSISADAYTPLIELNENYPEIGYSVLKNTYSLAEGVRLIKEHCRAPVVESTDANDKRLYSDFVANTDDTWTSFITQLISYSEHRLDIDPLGNIMFAPIQETAAIQPIWVFDDSNSSILLPDVSIDRDLYGVPNTVEVIYSKGTGYIRSVAVNDDPDSPISTVNRKRVITHRDSNPNVGGEPTQEMLDEYAVKLLKELSTLEYRVSYSHGYCPVRINDGVILDYKSAGLDKVKAKVITQSFECKTGCVVNETAVYSKKLWNGGS